MATERYRHWLLAAVTIATFTAGLLWMREALAQECFTPAQIETAVGQIDGAVIVHDLRGDDAVNWIVAFNRTPPQSAFMADHIIIVGRAGNPMAFVWLILDGCAVTGAPFPAAPILNLTDSVLGYGT